MTLDTLRQRLEEAKALDPVAQMAALREILRDLESGVEGDVAGVTGLRTEIVALMAAIPVSGTLETYPAWMSGGADALTGEEVSRRTLQAEAVALDQLEAWRTELTAAAEKAMARTGTTGFARGGFPLVQAAVARVTWQYASMKSEIHGLTRVLEGDGLSLAQNSAESARASFEGRVSGFFDEVTRKLDYGRDAVGGFLETMGLYFPMLNLANAVSQILIGKLFQIIGGIAGGVVGLLTASGKLGWLVNASEKLAVYRKKLFTLEKSSERGAAYNSELELARVRVNQWEQAARSGLDPGDARPGTALWTVEESQLSSKAVGGRVVSGEAGGATPVSATYVAWADDIGRQLEAARARVYQLETALRTGEMPAISPGTKIWVIDDAGMLGEKVVAQDAAIARIPVDLSGVEFVDRVTDYGRLLEAARVRVAQLETALQTGEVPALAPRGTALWTVDDAQLNPAVPVEVVQPGSGGLPQPTPSDFTSFSYGSAAAPVTPTVRPHVAGTTVWGVGGGVLGLEVRIASELEARVTPNVPAIVQEILGEHLEGLGEDVDLQSEADRLFEEHRAELEKRLQDEMLAAVEKLGVMDVEIPITEEEQTANDEAIWNNKLNAAWSALGRTLDLSTALQLREQLAMVCAEASTPDQQAYAQGLMALADEQVEILHQLLLEMYGASGSPDYTSGDFASQLKEATK